MNCRLIACWTAMLTIFPGILPGQTGPDDGNRPAYSVGASLRHAHYRSYSQLKSSVPMSIGYPIFHSRGTLLGISLHREGSGLDHHLSLTTAWFPSLSSDNGTGDNYLLDPKASHQRRISLLYHFSSRLLSWNRFSLYHGLAASLLYDTRKTTYQSGFVRNTRDLNPGVGGTLQLDINLFPALDLQADMTALFYIPHLNIGELSGTQAGDTRYSDRYHSFTYQARYGLALIWTLRSGQSILLGIHKKEWLGFGNRSPSFTTGDLITFKLDHQLQYTIGYRHHL